MKKLLLFVFIFIGFWVNAQELDEIYIRETFYLADSGVNKITSGDTLATKEYVDANGGAVSFGSQYQIPATNATTDDFNYDSGLRYYGDSLVVDNNSIVHGNVGIGTSSPTVALDIDSNNPILRVYAGINGRAITITPSSGALDAVGTTLQLNRFSTSPVTVGGSSTANLGVGTTSPQSKIHASGGLGGISTGISLDDGLSGFSMSSTDNLSVWAGNKKIMSFKENVTEQAIFNPDADYTGTAAAPSLAFGDGNTGFYEPSDNTLYFSIAGAARFQFSGGGFFGITTNAGGFLNEVPSYTNPTLFPSSANFASGIGGLNGDVSLITNSTEGVRVTEDTTFVYNYLKVDSTAIFMDNVGIGTTTPQERLHISGTGTQRLEIEAEDANAAVLKLTSTQGSFSMFTTADRLSFYDNVDDLERMSIDGDGKIGINGDLNLDAALIQAIGTIGDGDATPDVSGSNILIYPSVTTNVTITDLDNSEIGATYTIICTTGGFTVTINDGGNFNLEGNWTGAFEDNIVVMKIAASTFVEISRKDN